VQRFDERDLSPTCHDPFPESPTLQYLKILKDVCESFSIHPSVPSSVSSAIHGWHHIIILYNVKAEKLL
jgi:hypothetical protein